MTLTAHQIEQLTDSQLNQLLERYLCDAGFRKMHPVFSDSEKFMLKAVERFYGAYQWSSNRLKASEFNHKAVMKNGLVLAYVSDELKNNKNFVSRAVKQNGLALQFASRKLKNDEDIVLIAVRQNGLSLKDASMLLQQKQELINDALLQIYSKRNVFKGTHLSKINSETLKVFSSSQLAKFFADENMMKVLKKETIENGVNLVLHYMKDNSEKPKETKIFRERVFKLIQFRLDEINSYNPKQCLKTVKTTVAKPRLIECGYIQR